MGSKKNRLDILDKSISPGKMIILLAWPVFVEQLLSIMVNYVDTAMVASMGIDATAAISVNSSFLHLTMGLIMGISTGYSVLVSRSIGEYDAEKTKRIIRQSFYFIIGAGAVLTASFFLIFAPNLAAWMNADLSIRQDARDYLTILGYSRFFYVSLMVTNSLHRGLGDTKISMRSNIANNLINVAGNFLLIYPVRSLTVFGHSFTMWGAGLGVKGAAIATSAACVISAVYSLVVLFRKDSAYAVSLDQDFRFVPSIFRNAMSIGIPVALDRMIVSLGMMVVTRLCAGLGNATMAAHSYANTAESVCYMPVMGFSTAAQTMVAANLGARDLPAAKKYIRVSFLYSVSFMTAAAIGMYITAPYLIGFFTDDLSVIEMGSSALRIQAFAEPCFAACTVCGGILRGAGDTKFSVIVSIIGMWCVRIFFAEILIRNFGFGLMGIWIPMAADWFIRALVIGLRVKNGKWQNAWKPKETVNA